MALWLLPKPSLLRSMDGKEALEAVALLVDVLQPEEDPGGEGPHALGIVKRKFGVMDPMSPGLLETNSRASCSS